MIVVNVRVETDKESISNLCDAMAAMEAATRAEPGCQDYAFSVDLNDENVLRMTERWEDMPSLEAHFKTPHMATFNVALASLKPKSVDLRCYEATEVPLPSSK